MTSFIRVVRSCDLSHRFVTAHYELVPYLLTTGTEAYEQGVSSITPLARHQSFIDKVSYIV